MTLRSVLKGLFIDREFREEISFLRTVPLFSGLSDRALGKLLTITSSKTYGDGDSVFKEGVLGEVLYVVRSGQVVIQKSNREVRRYEPGDFLGELALLEETRRTSTARAAGATTLLLIYRVKFEGFLNTCASEGIQVLLALGRRLAGRLREKGEQDFGECESGRGSHG